MKLKTNVVKKIIFPILFVIFLIPTIILNIQLKNQPEETLGTQVSVKVTEISNSYGTPPESIITVKYNGEEYKLNGVSSDKLFVMQNSLKYGSSITAWLYDGELYYEQNSILLPIDKVYFAFLAATFACFTLTIYQLLTNFKQQRTTQN